MKTSIAVFICFLSMVVGNAQQKPDNNTIGPNFSWTTSTTFDFGSVKMGTSVASTFEFTNNGTEPLLLSNVKGSCGCTSVEYTQQPIAPGEKGFVKATFNAQAIGAFYKSVTITSNKQSKTDVLYIKGQVDQ